jgi:hypothetical protein
VAFEMPDSTAANLAGSPIERHECTSAEDLLERLSSRRPEWTGDEQEWMFRGQSDMWPLKAKTFRDDHEPFKQLGIPPFADPNSTEPRWPVDQWRLKRILQKFARELDRAGLEVPSPAPRIFRYPNQVSLLGEPGPQEWPTLALAQHHGLPTPWLDWSLQPRLAAYFACSDLVWKEPKPGTMVVWALRRDFIAVPKVDGPEEPRGSVNKVYLTVESAPRSGNSRLHAQAGLFTWLHGEDAHAQAVDDHVTGLAQQVATGTLAVPLSVRPPFMRCFSLDRQHAKPLLKLLHGEGVTAATAFPDYSGVVQTLKEREWCGGEGPFKPIA